MESIKGATTDEVKRVGLPTHEDLAAVGMTGLEFSIRYIEVVGNSRTFESVDEFIEAVKAKFYTDFPELAQRNIN